jgi:hypothetical protein
MSTAALLETRFQLAVQGGLAGFPSSERYALEEVVEGGPLFRLTSLDEPGLEFLVVRPAVSSRLRAGSTTSRRALGPHQRGRAAARGEPSARRLRPRRNLLARSWSTTRRRPRRSSSRAPTAAGAVALLTDPSRGARERRSRAPRRALGLRWRPLVPTEGTPDAGPDPPQLAEHRHRQGHRRHRARGAGRPGAHRRVGAARRRRAPRGGLPRAAGGQPLGGVAVARGRRGAGALLPDAEQRPPAPSA